MQVFLRIVSALLFSACSLFAVCVSSTSPGCVHYEIWTSAGTDASTNSPTAAQIDWFQSDVWRMKVTPGYWDSRLSWYPRAWAYMDAYGVSSDAASAIPNYIAHDQYGQWLYIPWGCSNGRCAQYAGDVSNPGFRQWWIDRARAVLEHGYAGLWIDDVNLVMRVGYGDGSSAAPVDHATGKPMSEATWSAYMADFMTQIRQAFPGAELVHNSIWFSGAAPRGSDPSVQKEIKAANWVNMERGIDDSGLTGGTGVWSVRELFGFGDAVHSLGAHLVWWDYGAPTGYNVAAYYLLSDGQDGYAAATPFWSTPDLLNAELGPAHGARYDWRGLVRRDFDKGMVLLDLPGSATVTADLGGSYRDTSGNQMYSVTLAAKQGAVLLADAPAQVQAPKTTLEYINVCGATTGVWQADHSYSGGHCDTGLPYVDLSSVYAPCPEDMYRSKRTTNAGDSGFSYVLTDLKPGVAYHIRLDFAESVYGAGGRLFDVAINGDTFLKSFDVAAAAGGKNRAVKADYYWAYPDAAGNVTIRLTNVRNNAMLNGITVITW
jgi:hypothetical protein